MVLAMAALGVEHHHGAPLEPLAPARALKIIQALHPAPHPGTQQDRGGGIEGGAQHRRDCEDDVARDHALVEDLASLADPVIHGDFGTPQAQRRLTTHRPQMLPLSTVQASICDRVG